MSEPIPVNDLMMSHSRHLELARKEEIAALKKERREIRREMKERGIKRTSCFNGGLTADESRYNSRLFAIECKLGRGT